MHKTTVPLHPAQRDVYIEQLLDRNSPLYNVGGYICLKGNLLPNDFIQVVQSAPAHFDAFRLRFNTNEPDFVAYVDESDFKLPVEQLDLSGSADATTEAMAFMRSDFNIAFNIVPDEILCKQVLIKISEDEYWFYGKYHHLVTDGYGFIVWVNYLALAYKTQVNRETVAVNASPYIPIMASAAEQYFSNEHHTDKEYWKQNLMHVPEPLLGSVQPAVKSKNKENNTLVISMNEDRQQLIAGFQKQSKSSSLLQLTIAALAVYFNATRNVSEMVFGIPVHRRSQRTVRNVVGMFSGILPHKIELDLKETTEDLVVKISDQLSKDFKHQNFLLGDLLRELKLTADQNTLFDVMVNYEPFHFQLHFGDDVEASIYQLASKVPRCPLQFTWQDHGVQQPFLLQVEYDTRHFTKTGIASLVDSFFIILKQFAEPKQSISDLEILSDSDRILLESFNGQKQQLAFQPAVQLFGQTVKQHPSATALIVDQTVYTYQQLNDRSNQVAHHLLSIGVQAGALVPVCIERCFDMVAAILGVLKIGAAYVPVDPAYPNDRKTFIINDTKCPVVVASKSAISNLAFAADVHIVFVDDLPNETTVPYPDPAIDLSPDQVSHVIYTSGSTGNPKGVMISHGNVSSFIAWCMQTYSIDDFEIVYATTSICFDLSVFELLFPLVIGKPIRLLDNGLQIPAFLSLDKKVLINTVPSVMTQLVKDKTDLYNVSLINMAGEPIPVQLVQQLDTDRIQVRNLYGPTEDTTYSTVFKLSNSGPVMIGKPILNTEVYIVNQNNQLVPPEVPGEIYLSGDGLALGYLNRPDLTKSKFVENFSIGGQSTRVYKTGDVGRWLSNGNLEYLGRLDNQVKLRGFRIELGEIENAIVKSGSVEAAIVTVIEQGENDKTLVGYVVGGAFNATEMEQFLKTVLPAYMVPYAWVQLEQLPMTPNGKIDRKNLPPPAKLDSKQEQYVPAENELQKQLVSIWQDVLVIDRIGINDHFYELGGHSIKAIQVITRLHKQLGVKIDFGQLSANPTISQLSKLLAAQTTSAYHGIPSAGNKLYHQLSHAQKRMYVLSQLKGGSVSLNGPAAFTITGDFNTEMLQKMLQQLVERHESLRTRFVEVNGQPMTNIIDAADLDLTVRYVDLSNTENADQKLEQLFSDEVATEFDFTKAPLLRTSLIRKNEREVIVLFTIHHIISDGWSRGILIKDFLTMLQQVASAQQVILSKIFTQYKDYADWQPTLFSEQKKYWQNIFSSGVPVLNFPIDFERPAIVSFEGGLLQHQLQADTTLSLKNFALSNGTTLNNLFFALYGALVAHHAGQNQLVIGSLASGRSHADLEEIVGLFINFLPIKLTIDPEQSVQAYLQQSHSTLVQSYNHQDYPFDLLVEAFVGQRDFSRNPMFDTMVNFHTEANDQATYEIMDNHGDRKFLVTPLDRFKENLFQSNLDFKLDVELHQNKLQLNLTYNKALFTHQRMETFLDQFVQLLNSITEKSTSLLSELLLFPVQQGLIQHQADMPGSEANLFPVCICSSFVCDPVLEYVDYWSGEYNLDLQVGFAEYNQVFQQLLDPQSAFNTNKGINVLFFRIEDWLREKPAMTDGEACAFLQQNLNDLIQALEHSLLINPVPVIAGIVPLNEHNTYSSEIKTFVEQLQQQLADMLQKQTGLHVINFNKVAALYDVEEMFDAATDKMGHLPFTPEFYAALGTYISRVIRAYKSKAYKVLALDCDNTLWRGICGEVGWQNVTIQNGFKALQQFLLEKYAEGFLLVLCSKNNEADAWEVFDNNAGMLLKREHIAAHRINWNDKPGNIAELAAELNVGLDSFIFIDDSAFEIAQMSENRPEVLSLMLPEDDLEFQTFLDHTWEFDVFKATVEDARRNDMYRTEKARKEESSKHGSIDGFLKSLQIKVEIRPMANTDIDRAVQLSLRTNQFNMNGVRLTRDEIVNHAATTESITWMIDVSDRFGDYGTAGLVLGNAQNDQLLLTTFLLSCRVLGRGVEELVLQELSNFGLQHHLNSLFAAYTPTSKNKPFEDFLSRTGWHADQENNGYNKAIKYSTEDISI